MTSASKPTASVAYLVTIFGMTLIGVVAVVTVFLMRPDKDNATLVVAILGFIGPTTAALLAFLKSQETHLVVNSRIDEFKEELRSSAVSAVAAARAEGLATGKEAGVAAADARTDQIAKVIPVPVVLPIVPAIPVLAEIAQNTKEIAKNTK